MNNVELEDLVLLTTLIFILFSIALFWRLYFFQPPQRTLEEDQLQHKSHSISNEASQLQSTLRSIDSNVDSLRMMVEAMQHRRNAGGGKDRDNPRT